MNDAEKRRLQQEAYEVGYEKGHRAGVRAAEPLPRVSGVAPSGPLRWEEAETRIDGYLRYENNALSALHDTLRAQFHAKDDVPRAEQDLHHAQADLAALRGAHSRLWWLLGFRQRRWVDDAHERLRHANDRATSTEQRIETLSRALTACREALDRELKVAPAAAEKAAGIRRESITPGWAQEYPDIDAFIQEDPRRAVRDYPKRRDAGGADYGSDWTLEDPTRPWSSTTWRISWLSEEATDEVYACEWGEGDGRKRVWVLGRLERSTTWGDDPLDKVLWALPHAVRTGRNSLVAAAEAIRELTMASTATSAMAVFPSDATE